MDITDVIPNDPHDQRSMVAVLAEMQGSPAPDLEAVWSRLRIPLEVHAKAEEVLFYPELLAPRAGAGGKDAPEDETTDAIAGVGRHPAGTPEWWGAGAEVNQVNGDHMAEEERAGLTDFHRQASLDLRHCMVLSFFSFESAHAGGITGHDVDPDTYARENQYQHPPEFGGDRICLAGACGSQTPAGKEPGPGPQAPGRGAGLVGVWNPWAMMALSWQLMTTDVFGWGGRSVAPQVEIWRTDPSTSRDVVVDRLATKARPESIRALKGSGRKRSTGTRPLNWSRRMTCTGHRAETVLPGSAGRALNALGRSSPHPLALTTGSSEVGSLGRGPFERIPAGKGVRV